MFESQKKFGAFVAILSFGFLLGRQYTLSKIAHRDMTAVSQTNCLLDIPFPENEIGNEKTEATGSSSRSCGNGDNDNNNNNNNNNTELGFLHIPKTGGSAIEEAAKNQAQKHWGYFAWDDRTKQSNWNNNMSEHHKLYRGIWHHMPPSDLSSMTNLSLAYHGQDLFAVIRNPFTRVVSEVMYRCRFGKIPKDKCLDKKYANGRIRQKLTKELEAKDSLGASMRNDQNHFMPQWYFFYNRFTLERQTRYLLHFENLAEDFSDLMDAFSLNITLKTSAALPAHSKTRRTNYTEIDPHLFHSVEDLDETTQSLIVKLYKMDFELGGYSLNAITSDAVSFSPLPNVSSAGSKFWELPCQIVLTPLWKIWTRPHKA